MLYPAPYAVSARLLPGAIIDAIAAATGYSYGELIGNMRPNDLVQARWACILGMAKLRMSTPQIGRWLRKDHSTVLYGMRRGRALRLVNPDFDALCRKVAG